ncbi:acyltransferase family protein [Crocinitomix algicola]|uniref:acyltransferase family protein n=1 Tax=Crocinitomix algicola TaxID=1740263 RepID=UPI000872B8E3|nr:acyltransferase [Crocinitomix algicola]
MNTGDSKKINSVYFQNLDAGRFIAAFSVFLLHFSNDLKGLFPKINESIIFKGFYLFTSKGSLGVNFFFVLSGFLITFLILKEKSDTGIFHVGKFLIRRTLRIWPLYFIVGGIGFGLFPVLFDDFHTAHQPINYFLFLANFDEIWYGFNDSINFLTAPWSVAVEEQFYLFWGLLLYVLFYLKKINLPIVILFLYLISFLFRYYYWENEVIIYHHTLSVCQDILTGSFIGWAVFNQKNWVTQLQQLNRKKLYLIYVIGVLIILGKNKIFTGELIIFQRFIFSLFFAFIILDQIGGKNSFFKLGRLKLLNHLGKLSYGIYMYHLVVMYLIVRFVPFNEFSIFSAILIYGLLSISGTYLMSYFSYKFVESKFLSLKPKNSK